MSRRRRNDLRQCLFAIGLGLIVRVSIADDAPVAELAELERKWQATADAFQNSDVSAYIIHTSRSWLNDVTVKELDQCIRDNLLEDEDEMISAISELMIKREYRDQKFARLEHQQRDAGFQQDIYDGTAELLNSVRRTSASDRRANVRVRWQGGSRQIDIYPVGLGKAAFDLDRLFCIRTRSSAWELLESTDELLTLKPKNDKFDSRLVVEKESGLVRESRMEKLPSSKQIRRYGHVAAGDHIFPYVAIEYEHQSSVYIQHLTVCVVRWINIQQRVELPEEDRIIPVAAQRGDAIFDHRAGRKRNDRQPTMIVPQDEDDVVKFVDGRQKK